MAIANEKEDYPLFAPMNTFLGTQKNKGIEFHSDWFDKTDDHHSVRVHGELNALRWIYKDYYLLPHEIYKMSDEQISEHYKQSSEKYEQRLEFDLMQMTNAAYWGVTDKNLRSRALALFHLATQKWNKDAYAWSCLAEGYERTGDLEKANQTINKSIQLGNKNNFPDMPYLENISRRIKSKLKD
jgi:hypothetical protein